MEVTFPAAEVGEKADYFKKSSCLSKTLEQVLTDQNAIGYFVQYLEARDALNLIKFWMDVEGKIDESLHFHVFFIHSYRPLCFGASIRKK